MFILSCSTLNIIFSSCLAMELIYVLCFKWGRCTWGYRWEVMFKSFLLRSLESLYLALLSRNYTHGIVIATKSSALMSLRSTLLELKGFCPPACISHLQSWMLLMHQKGLLTAAGIHTYWCSWRDESNPLPWSWGCRKRGTQHWFPFHLPKQENFASVCRTMGMKNATEVACFFFMFQYHVWHLPVQALCT